MSSTKITFKYFIFPSTHKILFGHKQNYNLSRRNKTKNWRFIKIKIWWNPITQSVRKLSTNSPIILIAVNSCKTRNPQAGAAAFWRSAAVHIRAGRHIFPQTPIGGFATTTWDVNRCKKLSTVPSSGFGRFLGKRYTACRPHRKQSNLLLYLL